MRHSVVRIDESLRRRWGLPSQGETRIAYVADIEGSGVGCAPCYTPAGGVAPLGKFQIYPQGRTFTVNIDDVGTQDGAGVWVGLGGNGVDFRGCLRVRTTRTFTGQTAGEAIWVVLHATRAVEDCPATAGVMTFTGV